MTDLVDGTTVPWHIVSGKTEPGTPAESSLPAPITRLSSPVRLADIQRGTAAIAAFGIAGRDLGHAIADNLRRLRGDT